MARRNSTVELWTVVTMAILVVSCANPTMQTTPMIRSTPPLSPIPPADAQRMMVLYPRGESPEWSSAYSRLEGAAFQL